MYVTLATLISKYFVNRRIKFIVVLGEFLNPGVLTNSTISTIEDWRNLPVFVQGIETHKSHSITWKMHEYLYVSMQYDDAAISQ